MGGVNEGPFKCGYQLGMARALLKSGGQVSPDSGVIESLQLLLHFVRKRLLETRRFWVFSVPKVAKS